MHVLITADTVGGVWTYTQELVSGLVRRDVRVTLVSFGRMPSPEQTAWLLGLPNLDYRPTPYQLEWMREPQRDIESSCEFLEAVIREVRPDLLHLNQYCYGTVSPWLPRVVVAHSDVVSWWEGVHGHEPEDNPWIRWYRETVISGLSCADVVIAPSQWMLNSIRRHYVRPSYGMVIHNGRNPGSFDAWEQKDKFVLGVGRLWDSAKQVSLLLQRDQKVPVWIVGSQEEPGNSAEIKPLKMGRGEFKLVGEKSQDQLRGLFAHAGIYAATSRYEPFGLAPLEAAFSRCALVMNDLPVFHELWGDAAYYFKRNDPDDLARRIRELSEDSELRREMAQRAYDRANRLFTAEKMVDQYESLYHSVSAAEKVA
jgi:glycosyltransferase involved in cell wall biosynthesis